MKKIVKRLSRLYVDWTARRKRKKEIKEIIKLADFFAEKERGETMDKRILETTLAWIFVLSINAGITIFVYFVTAARVSWYLTFSIAFSSIAFGLYLLVVLIKFLLGPDELGGTTIFGKPHRTISSGLNFGLWPFEQPVKLPKGRLELNFPAGEINTKAGIFELEYTDSQGTKVKDVIKLESEKIEVDSGAYTSFSPKKEDILQAIQFLPPDVLKAKEKGPALEKFLGQLVISTTRTTAADRTWVDDNNKRDELAETIQTRLIKPGGTFDLAGLADNLEIVITNVKLPPELQKTLMELETERYKASQTIIKAEGEKKATITAAEATQAETILKADGDLHRKKQEAEALKINLQKQLEAFGVDAKDFMDYLVSFEAAKGYGEGDKTVPILLGGATNLFDLAKNIAATVRGVSPSDIKPEDIKAFLSSEEGKKLIAEEIAKSLGNNKGNEVLDYLL
ncbi:MAG: Band 7/Mec-2 family protein [Parcubacteria group bacterium GW2011_GWF2_42_7]|nr:MAG: Band 7/Mec-2 family protein [Parcubacteria group bacterium GW2011_GWF2_42_7]